LEIVVRIFAVLALSLALGGCFSSERPLFAEASGQCPFIAPTTLQEIDETPSTFVFAPDGAYCRATNDQGKVSRTLFVPIGGQWWIVQDDGEHPSYLLVHRTGSRLMQYLPKCEEFSESRLRQLGVTFDSERRYCTANDAHQIELLFRSWRWGWFHQPVGAFRIVGAATGSRPQPNSATPAPAP
jgi:hypothetical protein